MDDNQQNVAEVVKPDSSWSRTQPIHLVATKAQLDMPHSVCDMKNTDQQQVHVIIDRYNTGHELQPGQTKTVEMIDTHLDYFRKQREGNRVDHLGRPKPPHPVIIIGARKLEEQGPRPSQQRKS